MRSSLVVGLFKLAASLPLGVLHHIGAMLSWVTYWLSVSYAGRLRENLASAYPDLTQKEFRQTLHAIRRRLDLLVNLPTASVERLMLQSSARSLSQS